MCNHSPSKAKALNLQELPWGVSQTTRRVPECRPSALRRTDSICPLGGSIYLLVESDLWSCIVMLLLTECHNFLVFSGTWISVLNPRLQLLELSN